MINDLTRSKIFQGSVSVVSQLRPLRILLVTARYLPYVGGTEIHTYEVARRLAAAGNDVTILTTDADHNLPPCEDIAGIHIHRVLAWPSRGDYYFSPGIYSFISRGKWDVIHCQGYHTLVAPEVMLAASRAKIPYVVTFHSGGHSSRLRNALRPLQRALLRPLLAQAAGLVGVSRWEVDFFKKHLNLPGDKFRMIPNGTYLPTKDVQPDRRQDGTLIVSVGRLERYKGHHRVIAALPEVIRHVPDAQLRIVGAGPYESALRQLAMDLGVHDRVEIQAVGGGDRDAMASLLMGAALVILLSDYESQGMAVLEALVLGRPVLVADSTALRELATSGLARATSLGSNPEEVATAILDQLQRPLIPQNAELPTWEACVDELLALYHRAASGRAV
jgi:glycogen synthase